MTDRDALYRSFSCAGRLCTVSLAPLRTDDGSPRFYVTWLPGPPPRMLPGDLEDYEAGRRLAEHVIRTRLGGKWA
jgi:hypothetical protein